MPPSPPTPPEALAADVVAALDELSPAQLRRVSAYAEDLAAFRDDAAQDRVARERERPERQGDRPDDVPAKATLTVKEINDNRYYYWQWREGDKVKSKYKGPAGDDSE